MAGEFAGKVVVVTGGSRGIGRAIAVAFAREGAQTVLAATSRANLAEASKAVVGGGRGGAASGRGRSQPARRVSAAVRAGERALQALRRAHQQCRRHARRKFPQSAGRGLAGGLRAEILRGGAHHPIVLAAAEGGGGLRGQYRGRGGTHARCRFPDWRGGQRRDRERLQGAGAARQPRGGQRERRPSRHDRDRPGRAIVPRFCAPRRARRRRISVPRQLPRPASGGSASRRMSPSLRCSCAGRRRATSRARPSPSMAARSPVITERRRSCARYRWRDAGASPTPPACGTPHARTA